MKIEFLDIEKKAITSYNENTYDIEVAKAHSYNIKGVIVHNSACSTSPNTGFGTRNWQLSAIKDVVNDLDHDIVIIADGGIRNYGDIAKAIAFGADFVMVGSMFAGHDENPGEVVEVNGEKMKAYYGSASAQQKGENHYVEGVSMLLPYKGSIDETLKTIKQNLQSAVSYAGGDKLEDLFNVEYVLLNRR